MQEQIAKQQKAAETEADQMRRAMDKLRLQVSKLENEASASARSAEDAQVCMEPLSIVYWQDDSRINDL